MFVILGSGFGFYGYLPALVRCGQTVVLPERYRERFQSRGELAQFSDSITWVRDETAALDCASGAVIALRPGDQGAWIARCLAQPGIQWLMLEKPLASSPEEAGRLQKQLVGWGRSFRVGYTFCPMPWASVLREFTRANPDTEISIDWCFMAHHFRQELSNWKRWSDEGGGAVRFYGIQLIAVLAELGYHDVVASRSFGVNENEVVRWTATLAGQNIPLCRLSVDCRSGITRFSVISNSDDVMTSIAEQPDPFGVDRNAAMSGGIDSRVEVLEGIVRSLLTGTAAAPAWYSDVLRLWQLIEDRTGFSQL